MSSRRPPAHRSAFSPVQKAVVFGVVLVLFAGFVGAMAFSDSGNTVANTGSANNGITTTRTFTPGPPEDEKAYFSKMSVNWESTWARSNAASQALICERWLADPFSLLTVDSIPPNLPSNITQETYRKRLSDFLIGKCGMPQQPTPTAPPAPTLGS